MRAVSQTQMSRALPCCKPAEYSYSRTRIMTVRTGIDAKVQGGRPSRAAPRPSLIVAVWDGPLPVRRAPTRKARPQATQLAVAK